MILFLLLVWSALCDGPIVGAQSAGGYLTYNQLNGKPYTVEWDERSLIVAGRRTLLLGASVHYSRADEGDWATLFAKAKSDGFNCIQTDVFWNFHEFNGGVFDFSGRANISSFISQAAQAGLFVFLRVGPFVGSEWNYGGLPIWLNWVEDIYFRDNNSAWQLYVSNFIDVLLSVIEGFLPSNGGPVIIGQIENDYTVNNTAYINWCGNLTATLNLGIPWTMCNGTSSPQTIGTCSGDDCAASFAFAQTHLHPNQPLLWPEDPSNYETWSSPSDLPSFDNRPAQDIAYAIAKWFAFGGAYHNFYMWYGGNNIARWASSSIANMYADGSNIHSDMTVNEPKNTHLIRLLNVISSFNDALVSVPAQMTTPVAIAFDNTKPMNLIITPCNALNFEQNFTFVDGHIRAYNDHCVTSQCGESCYPLSLSPCSDASDQIFAFSDTTYAFEAVSAQQCLDVYESAGPPVGLYGCSGNPNQEWTICSNNSIVSKLRGDKCMTLVQVAAAFAYVYQSPSQPSQLLAFLVNNNTANLSVIYNDTSYFLPSNSVALVDYAGTVLFNTSNINATGLPVRRVYENFTPPGSLSWSYWTEPVPATSGPFVSSPTPLEQLYVTQDQTEYLFYSFNATLTSSSMLQWQGWKSNSYSVFVDGVFAGSTFDNFHTSGENDYQLQLPENAVGFRTITILSGSLGIDDNVIPMRAGTNQEKKGIVGQAFLQGVAPTAWLQRPYLTGELNGAYTGTKTVPWTSAGSNPPDTPLTWFKTTFATPPSSSGSVVINMSGATRGHLYVNGVDLGRYWMIQEGGAFVQQYYYVPRSLLQTVNTLVIIEELGIVDISLITIAVVSVQA